MLRYKTKTRPGLVALYDIRPGNGAGPFLQPRSPRGNEMRGIELRGNAQRGNGLRVIETQLYAELATLLHLNSYTRRRQKQYE